MKLRIGLPGTLALALSISGTALADINAGTDAWTRGDYPAAIKEWEGPAARGDAEAQYYLGQAYRWGRGVKQDLKKAELYFGKAAAQGHIEASDIYGLLLFDRGEKAMALPYIKAAAGRGEARAQYLLSIMHFNGDMVPKDWVRAYALMSLSQQAGLPQATPGLQQMDGHIPLAQRQQAVGLAQQLAAEAEATRNRQFAANDLGIKNPAGVNLPPQTASIPARRQPTPEEAVAEAERVSSGASPRSAGADYARPNLPPANVTTPKPVTLPQPKPFPTTVASRPAQQPVQTGAAPAAQRPTASGGAWRIQLGAFGVSANADALWARIKSRPEVAGHARINIAAGAVTKLQAGGYTEDAARAACRGLSAAGIACTPVSR